MTNGSNDDSMQQQQQENHPSTKPVVLGRRRSLVQQVTNVSTEVTRRMVCGGLAGMIAKASAVYFVGCLLQKWSTLRQTTAGKSGSSLPLSNSVKQGPKLLTVSNKARVNRWVVYSSNQMIISPSLFFSWNGVMV
jgi:hypothetical protein